MERHLHKDSKLEKILELMNEKSLTLVWIPCSEMASFLATEENLRDNLR
jgi:hypothetical protein